MRAMYSLVSASDVSLPDAISAWSCATVASLCRFGTPSGSTADGVPAFAKPKLEITKVARMRVLTDGQIILSFLLEAGRAGTTIGKTRGALPGIGPLACLRTNV